MFQFFRSLFYKINILQLQNYTCIMFHGNWISIFNSLVCWQK